MMIGITNSVGRLSSAEIEQMVKDAEQFKQADLEFTARHEARAKLEQILAQNETSLGALSKSMRGLLETAFDGARNALENPDSSAAELAKVELTLKRALQKAQSKSRSSN